MTDATGRSRAFWIGLLVVFLLALLPRLIHPVSRPLEWYLRSVRFWNALQECDLRGTYQRYHPGVSTMWVAGFGLRVYAWTHGWSGDDLLTPPDAAGDYRPYPVEAGVVALSVAIALCICLSYVQLVRLLGWRTGAVAASLIALDPFYVSGSKVLHVDALLATLMVVSALYALRYIREGSWKPLILGAVFAGLSFLTKGPSLFLIPYMTLIVVYRHYLEGEAPRSLARVDVWSSRIAKIARDIIIWGGTAALVFMLLWPAMWVMPREALSTMARRILFHVETVHRNPNFFAGRAIETDPGILFYLATIGWKTTLITLPALFVSGFFLLRQVKRWRENNAVWWVLIFVGGFTVALTFAARKEMRYLLPIFPALDVLAGWGLMQTIDAATALSASRRRLWVRRIAAGALIVAQFTVLVAHHPYYGTHHNLLLGGSRVAQHVLPLGDQGEGQDLAARFLADFPHAEDRMIGVHRRYEELFERIFPGRSEGLEDPYVDYYVFGINSIQRQNRLELWDDAWALCQAKDPLWTASFGGVTYAWIYGGFDSDPQAFPIDHAVDFQFGEHVRLVGYTVSVPEAWREDPPRVILFWQSDGRLTEDYHVFVHLVDEDGTMVAQHDGVPGQRQRPTWEWRYLEIVEDEHTINVREAAPGKTYSLYVGMYDYETLARLPIIDPGGDTLPDDQVALQEIRLSGAPE